MDDTSRPQGKSDVMFSQQTRLLMLITTLALVCFLWMIKWSLITLFMSAILAALTYPLYTWFLRKTNNRTNLSAGLTTTTVLALIVFPAIALSIIFVNQTQELISHAVPWWKEQLEQLRIFTADSDNVKAVSSMQNASEWLLKHIDSFTSSMGAFIFKAFGSLTTGAAMFLLNLVVFVFALAYFLINGARLAEQFEMAMGHLTGVKSSILNRIFVVSRSTIKGTLVIALVQGSLGGAAFYFAGVPSAVFWAGMMAFLSIIPLIGPPLIWAPVAIVFILNGQVPTGIFILLWGGIVISNIDNLLRPILVGSDTGLPNIIVLISTLGGIALMGGVGIILGPVVAAVCISFIGIFLKAIDTDYGEASALKAPP